MDTTKNKFSFKLRFRRIKLGFEGVGNLIDFEPNAWIDIAAAIIVIIAGIEFGLSTSEWIFVVLAIGFVLTTVAISIAVELLASAPEMSEVPLINEAKSLGAAAVLIANVTAFIVGILIFTPKIFI
jgi:diacylglycerol kinase